MSGRIFILIETERGRTKEVCAALKQLSGVRTIDLVSQPYDIIVVAETAGDVSHLDREIEPISGVVRTVVCAAGGPALAVDLQSGQNN